MIIKRPTKRAKHEENTYKLTLAGINLQYDVPWYDNPGADVVDLTFKFDNGDMIMQRETLSFNKKSNFASLIKAITGKLPNPYEDYDADEIIGGVFLGDLLHITRKNGDVMEVVKNFRYMNSELQDGSF